MNAFEAHWRKTGSQCSSSVRHAGTSSSVVCGESLSLQNQKCHDLSEPCGGVVKCKFRDKLLGGSGSDMMKNSRHGIDGSLKSMAVTSVSAQASGKATSASQIRVRHGHAEDDQAHAEGKTRGDPWRAGPKGVEQVTDSVAPGGTRGRRDHADQEVNSVPPSSTRDRHEQGSSQEGGPASLCGAAFGHAVDLQRDDRAVEGEGTEPHVRDHRWASHRPGGLRKAFRQDIPGVSFEGTNIPSVGNQDQERGRHLSEAAEVGSLGRDGRGHGLDADGDGGLDGRIPSPEDSHQGEVVREGLAIEEPEEFPGCQQPIECHGRNVHGDDEPSEDLDPGGPGAQGRKGSEDTLRKGREYFERVGEDGRDPISPVSLAVEQKADPGDCLGSYRELTKLEKPERQRLNFAAQRSSPETFQQLVSYGRPVLFEVACSPDSVLSTQMAKMTGDSNSVQRLSFWNGFDLTKNEGVRAVMSKIDSCKPMHVWLSLECGPFSQMQNVNQRTPQQVEELKRKRENCMRQYVGGLLIYTYCAQLGIPCTWEWSETCNAWRLPMVQRVFNKVQPRFVVTKGCRVQLRDPKSKKLMAKGWKLATTHELLADRMDMPCTKDHEHALCQGQLTRLSAYYTEEFGRRVCRAILDGLDHEGLLSEMHGKGFGVSCAMFQDFSCSCDLVCHPKSELRCSSCEKQTVGEDPLNLSHVAEDLVPLSDLEKERCLKQIARLHRNTGHGSLDKLVNALKTRQTDPRIVELAKQYKCPVCEESQRRVPRPRSTLEPLPPKWSVIQVDNAHWKHPITGQRVDFSMIVDEGCRFKLGRLFVKEKGTGISARQMIGFFQESWKPVFGTPDKIRMDPAGPWRSGEIIDYFDSLKVEVDTIPAESHWQISHVERAIGSVKHVMNMLVRDDPQLTPEEAFSEAIRVGNEKEVVRGYSPCQHALGRTPDTSGRLHVSALDDVPPVLCENSEGEFHRNMNRMKVAEQAFSEWVFQERMSRAKNTRSYRLQEFFPGDLVYVWRVQNVNPRGGGFTGPGRVLAVETRKDEDGNWRPGSVVWVTRGSRLLKAAPQQVRRATVREQCLEELNVEPNLPWTMTKLTEDLYNHQFEDVTDEIPDDMEFEQGLDEEQVPQPRHRVRQKRTVEECPMPARTARKLGVEVPDGRNIAVPDQDVDVDLDVNLDDDYAECFWAEETAAVELSFEVPETNRGRKFMCEHFESFMVSQLRRRAVEVSEKHLTEDELEQMKQAKQVEVKKFIGAEALEVLPKHLQPKEQDSMKMRWVLTWKRSDSGEKTAKARCVILGYLDPEYAFRQTAAPTMSRTTRQILLALSSALGFQICKGDVSGAFLQGREYQGTAYVIPTWEICEAMSIPQNSVTKLRKACYGLVDAPLEWFLTVSDFLTSIGFVRCVTDPCCFKYVSGGKLIGLISGHVDDFLFCGPKTCETWKQLCDQIRKKFQWGTWETDEAGFTQCGVHIVRRSDGGFELSQTQYVDDLKEIAIPSERRKTPDAETSERERSKLRAALGALSWCAQQTSPHVAAAVSLQLSQVNRSTVRTMIEVNKIVFQVKANRKHKLIVHGGLSPNDILVAGWADASGQNRIDGKSTQGLFVGVTSMSLLQGAMCPISAVSWNSSKITRQCRSPGAAESLAAIDCEDFLYAVRLQLFEMKGGVVSVRRTSPQVSQIPAVLITDSTNVYDRLQNTVYVPKGPERRVALEMIGLKEAIEETGLVLRWVHSDAQLSNSLTKDNEPHQLVKFYQLNQHWRIVEDPNMQSAKNRRKQGIGALDHVSISEGFRGHVSS